MKKAQDLLNLCKSITEEGEMGPLNLAVGSKVICTMDGKEMPCVVAADDSGKFYDAEKDMYYVDCAEMGKMWCAAKDMKMAEAKKPAQATKPGVKKFEERLAALRARNKKNEDDSGAPMAGNDPEQMKQIMAECYGAAMDNVNMMKECMGMREDDSEYGNTMVALGSMYDAGKALGEAMEGDGLSIPGDGGGAGMGGTEIPTPAGGSEQPAPSV